MELKQPDRKAVPEDPRIRRKCESNEAAFRDVQGKALRSTLNTNVNILDFVETEKSDHDSDSEQSDCDEEIQFAQTNLINDSNLTVIGHGRNDSLQNILETISKRHSKQIHLPYSIAINQATDGLANNSQTSSESTSVINNHDEQDQLPIVTNYCDQNNYRQDKRRRLSKAFSIDHDKMSDHQPEDQVDNNPQFDVQQGVPNADEVLSIDMAFPARTTNNIYINSESNRNSDIDQAIRSFLKNKSKKTKAYSLLNNYETDKVLFTNFNNIYERSITIHPINAEKESPIMEDCIGQLAWAVKQRLTEHNSAHIIFSDEIINRIIHHPLLENGISRARISSHSKHILLKFSKSPSELQEGCSVYHVAAFLRQVETVLQNFTGTVKQKWFLMCSFANTKYYDLLISFPNIINEDFLNIRTFVIFILSFTTAAHEGTGRLLLLFVDLMPVIIKQNCWHLVLRKCPATVGPLLCKIWIDHVFIIVNNVSFELDREVPGTKSLTEKIKQHLELHSTFASSGQMPNKASSYMYNMFAIQKIDMLYCCLLENSAVSFISNIASKFDSSMISFQIYQNNMLLNALNDSPEWVCDPFYNGADTNSSEERKAYIEFLKHLTWQRIYDQPHLENDPRKRVKLFGLDVLTVTELDFCTNTNQFDLFRIFAQDLFKSFDDKDRNIQTHLNIFYQAMSNRLKVVMDYICQLYPPQSISQLIKYLLAFVIRQDESVPSNAFNTMLQCVYQSITLMFARRPHLKAPSTLSGKVKLTIIDESQSHNLHRTHLHFFMSENERKEIQDYSEQCLKQSLEHSPQQAKLNLKPVQLSIQSSHTSFSNAKSRVHEQHNLNIDSNIAINESNTFDVNFGMSKTRKTYLPKKSNNEINRAQVNIATFDHL